jgi:lipopolysaccharide/colanic/teichoic acid biosynthesis glycosyltransferase
MLDQRIMRDRRRLNVKPGMAGRAPVSGLRGEVGTGEKMLRRVEYGFSYIDNWSIAFGICTMALTVGSRKAYRNAV